MDTALAGGHRFVEAAKTFESIREAIKHEANGGLQCCCVDIVSMGLSGPLLVE